MKGEVSNRDQLAEVCMALGSNPNEEIVQQTNLLCNYAFVQIGDRIGECLYILDTNRC